MCLAWRKVSLLYPFIHIRGKLILSLELHALEIERASMQIEDEGIVREYYDLRQQLNTYTKDMRDVITHPSYCLQFLQSGRLVRVKHNDHDFGWGAPVECFAWFVVVNVGDHL